MHQVNLILKIVFSIMCLFASDKYYGCGGGKHRLESLKITQLALKIDSYRFYMGAYPKSLLDLTSEEYRIEYGIMTDPQDLKDVWDNQYHYTNYKDDTFELISFGKDGKLGGTGKDEDFVVSTNKLKLN